MGRFSFFGEGLPGIDLDELKGKLIVLEGTDGVGRSTHIGLLKSYLEHHGHAVLHTGMTRSALAGKRLKKAKEGHTLGGITMSLFYATDFADRLENEIIPALRATTRSTRVLKSSKTSSTEREASTISKP